MNRFNAYVVLMTWITKESTDFFKKQKTLFGTHISLVLQKVLLFTYVISALWQHTWDIFLTHWYLYDSQSFTFLHRMIIGCERVHKTAYIFTNCIHIFESASIQSILSTMNVKFFPLSSSWIKNVTQTVFRWTFSLPFRTCLWLSLPQPHHPYGLENSGKSVTNPSSTPALVRYL